MKRTCISTLALSAAFLAYADWDVRGDFSLGGNPNGSWSYGYSDSLTSDFVPYDISGDNGDFIFWRSSNIYVLGTPSCGVNISGRTINGIPPDAFTTHPGPSQLAMIRWQAPKAMDIDLIGEFGQGDGGSVDCCIRLNGTYVLNMPNAYASQQFAARLSVSSGDYVEFLVGNAGSFYYDSTPLSIHISPIAPISGHVQFGDLAGQLPGTFELEFQNLSHELVDTTLATVRPGGLFGSEFPSVQGLQYLVARKTHWLKKETGPVDTTTNLTGLEFQLVNGDVDGDNEITLVDYSMLAAAFGSAPGDGNWNPNADLDEDGEVTLSDYSILSRNFGQFGDE